MAETLLYLFAAALFVMVQVAVGGKKKKKSSSNRRRERQAEIKKAVPLGKTGEKTAEESARVFMEDENAFDDPCESENAPRIHLHQVDEQTMEQAGEGEDPCHAGSAPKRPPLDDDNEQAEETEEDTQRAAFQSDVLRGVIMSEILTRPGERAAIRRMKRGR